MLVQSDYYHFVTVNGTQGEEQSYYTLGAKGNQYQ